jgi:hypothetical protein
LSRFSSVLITAALILLLLGSGYKDNIDVYDGGAKIIGEEKNNDHMAYAHFFGATKKVDNYQIVFQPFPFVPFVGDNSTTLNFSVLDNNNSNVNNIYAALVIKERNTGNVLEQIPYKFCEFSDITFRYPFQHVGNFVVTLEAKINGDPKYQDNPLLSNFEISVNDLRQMIPFSQLMLYYITPSTAAVASVAVYLISRKKANKQANG